MSADYRGPLCGDATCRGCPTQADLDGYHQRQWDDAGQLVADALGLTYPFAAASEAVSS